MEDLKKKIKRVPLTTVAGILVALYIAFYLVETVYKNYKLQNEIGTLEGQIEQLEDEKQQLSYKIQYYQTDSFKEKEARAKLGLQAEGEGVVIIPKQNDAQESSQNQKKEPEKSNFAKWIEFLSGRHS